MMKEESEKAVLKLKKLTSWPLVPITSWQIDGETMETLTGFIFLGSKITADSGYRHEIKRYLLFGRKAMTNLDSILKSRDITLLTKIHIVKAMVFPVVMYGCELDHKENRVSKNLCFWTVVLEDSLKSPLDSKEIQPVPPKGNRSRTFIGRIDAEAETPILWPLNTKNWLIWKDPDAGQDWRHEEKGITEDEIVGWHHRLDGCEFEWAPGVGDGQGPWHAAVHGVTKSQTCLSDWTGLKSIYSSIYINLYLPMQH